MAKVWTAEFIPTGPKVKRDELDPEPTREALRAEWIRTRGASAFDDDLDDWGGKSEQFEREFLRLHELWERRETERNRMAKEARITIAPTLTAVFDENADDDPLNPKPKIADAVRELNRVYANGGGSGEPDEEYETRVLLERMVQEWKARKVARIRDKIARERANQDAALAEQRRREDELLARVSRPLIVIDDDNDDDDDEDDNVPLSRIVRGGQSSAPPVPQSSAPSVPASAPKIKRPPVSQTPPYKVEVGDYFNFAIGSDRYTHKVTQVLAPNLVVVESTGTLKYEPTAGTKTWREVKKNDKGAWVFKDKSRNARFSRHYYNGKTPGPVYMDPGF